VFVPIFKELEYSSVLSAEVGIIRQHRSERQFEERMESYALSVYGGYACRGEYDMFLLGDGTDIF
jgi:hypothetical protein